MSYHKYYEDELNYLRELGAIFAESNPEVASFLSEKGHDPDVERLLEGFAFLTARIRQKLDDELPEVSQSLINLVWPNYLKPVPAMNTLQFIPKHHSITSKKSIERWTEVASVPVEGTACTFRTCFAVDVLPIELQQVVMEDKTDGAKIELSFSIDASVASEQMELDKLRLHLHDDQNRRTSRVLYLWLFNYLKDFDVTLTLKNGEKVTHPGCSPSQIKSVGFRDLESLLPGTENVFSGYRLIQEFFQFPQKFLYFDIDGLAGVFAQPKVESFVITLNFNRQFQSEIKVKRDNFRLFCTPIVNLFSNDAEPIRVEHQRVDYLVRPSVVKGTHKSIDHVEIFSIENVTGTSQSKRTDYPAYESFEHAGQLNNASKGIYYKLKTSPSVVSDNGGVDHYLRLINTQQVTEQLMPEKVSLGMLCSNGKLAEQLKPGQIGYDPGKVLDFPRFVTFTNISVTSPAVPPPLENDSHWRLVSNLALHYRSLGSEEALKQLIKFYDIRARKDRNRERASDQMCDGIEKIHLSDVGKLIEDKPVLGLQTAVYLRESKFGAKGIQGEANMYLFASVLNHYFSQYAQTNSFHHFIVRGVERGETYQWPLTKGTRPRF